MQQKATKAIGNAIGKAIGNFLIISFFLWVASWAFDFIFTWKLAVGLYAVMALVRSSLHPIRVSRED